MSIAGANTVLNTIVADALSDIADEIETASDFDMCVHDLIKRTVTQHQRIIFNGNGYAKEWLEEAKWRGLPNLETMVDAIPCITDEKVIQMFEKFGVYNSAELNSRAEINYEAYSKAIHIEAKTMIEMASKKYIPAIITYTKNLADSINAVKAAVPEADSSVQVNLLKEVSTLLTKTNEALNNLKEKSAQALKKEAGKEQAEFFKDEVVAAMAALRSPVDELEMLVDKNVWPVPTYGDLLFEV